VTELLAQAAAAADRNDWEAAADILAPAPRTDEVLDRYGWYCSRAKRYDEAVRVFTELQQRRPHDYLPPYMLGFQYYQRQLWAEALPHFDRALQLWPDHINSLWRKANALHQLGRETQAVLTAGKLLRVWTALPADKQDADKRRYAQACHLIARGQVRTDPAGAVALLREAVRHEPTDPYHHQQLAKSLLRAGGSADEAMAAAAEARRLKPGEPAIELQVVACSLAVGRPQDALAALRRPQRRLNGWFAYKGARIALDAGDPRLSCELAARACQDRKLRREAVVQELLRTATAALGDVPAAAASEPSSSGARRRARSRDRAPDGTRPSGPRRTGTVAVLRPDRGFGFLVEDDGTRRHFRVKTGTDLTEGTTVSFVPREAEKGPAAADVCAV
jgi:tetratricopeptide (TPR) repeat protein/cold shock CspA family protein